MLLPHLKPKPNCTEENFLISHELFYEIKVLVRLLSSPDLTKSNYWCLQIYNWSIEHFKNHKRSKELGKISNEKVHIPNK